LLGIKSLFDYTNYDEDEDDEEDSEDGGDQWSDDEEYKLFLIPVAVCKDALITDELYQDGDCFHTNVFIYLVRSQNAGVFQHLQYLKVEGCLS
jgi:hypothetical protein